MRWSMKHINWDWAARFGEFDKPHWTCIYSLPTSKMPRPSFAMSTHFDQIQFILHIAIYDWVMSSFIWSVYFLLFRLIEYLLFSSCRTLLCSGRPNLYWKRVPKLKWKWLHEKLFILHYQKLKVLQQSHTYKHLLQCLHWPPIEMSWCVEDYYWDWASRV